MGVPDIDTEHVGKAGSDEEEEGGEAGNGVLHPLRRLPRMTPIQ